MGSQEVPSPASTSSDGGGRVLQTISLEPSPTDSNNKNLKKRSTRFLRKLRTVVRSLPIIRPAGCKMPALGGPFEGRVRVTGTLYGQRRARINLAIQENPRCLPTVVLELAVQTGRIFQDFREGIVRIALECERQAGGERTRISEEPIWTMYWNGKKTGYGIRREPTPQDLSVMQVLRAASMGVGMLPSDPPEGDLVYMRASFERVVGSRDSETYYMLNPDDNTGPEVTIFFVRV